jgi:hypothetical protein
MKKGTIDLNGKNLKVNLDNFKLADLTIKGTITIKGSGSTGARCYFK